MNEAAAIVARGAEVLDEHGPKNWHLLITQPVDVLSTDACPLGQIYGDYFDSAATSIRYDHLSNGAGYYGFDGGQQEDETVDGVFKDGDDLVNEAWDALIAERKGVVKTTEKTFTLSELQEALSNGTTLRSLVDPHTTRQVTLSDLDVERIGTALAGHYGDWSDTYSDLAAKVGYAQPF